MNERYWTYHPIPVPGEHLHFVCKRQGGQELDQDTKDFLVENGGRSYILKSLHENNIVYVREDYGLYCLVDVTAQPDDDNPLLVAKGITERVALQHIRKHYKDHIETASGLEYDNLHMVEDVAKIQHDLLAEMVAAAQREGGAHADAAAARLGDLITRNRYVKNTADRRIGLKRILELMIDQVTGFEETTETLLHLVVRRARVLIEYLRVQSLKAAFEQVRIDRAAPRASIESLQKQYPDDVLNQHHLKFQEMLRQWQVYIRRDDFETITRLRQKSWHWTDAALKQHVAAFAAADAAASEGE